MSNEEWDGLQGEIDLWVAEQRRKYGCNTPPRGKSWFAGVPELAPSPSSAKKDKPRRGPDWELDVIEEAIKGE